MDHAYRSWHWYFLCQPADFPERAINAAPDVFFERRPTSIFVARGSRRLLALLPEPGHDPGDLRGLPGRHHRRLQGRRGGLRQEEDHLPDADALGLAPCVAAGHRLRRDLEDWADDVRGQGIDSGHFMAEENPEETYAALRAFFAE